MYRFPIFAILFLVPIFLYYLASSATFPILFFYLAYFPNAISL